MGVTHPRDEARTDSLSPLSLSPLLPPIALILQTHVHTLLFSSRSAFFLARTGARAHTHTMSFFPLKIFSLHLSYTGGDRGEEGSEKDHGWTNTHITHTPISFPPPPPPPPPSSSRTSLLRKPNADQGLSLNCK